MNPLNMLMSYAFDKSPSHRPVWRLLPLEAVPVGRQMVFGAACSGGAVLLRLPLEPFLEGRAPFVLFFPAATWAALRGGSTAAATAVAIAVVYAVITPGLLFHSAPQPWLPLALFAFASALIGLTVRELRLAVNELRVRDQALQAAHKHAHLLVCELEHRVKNSLALASALVKMTARHSENVADFVRRFEPRLQALSRAQTLLTQTEWRAPNLSSLIEDSLAPFLGTIDPAIVIVPGGTFTVPVASAVSLILILHELATNAVKHGALSRPGGKVQLSWVVEEGAPATRLDWIETGVAKISDPNRTGFGAELFRVLGRDSIRIHRAFQDSGFTCRIHLKADRDAERRLEGLLT